MADPALLERDRELDRAALLLERARAGTGGALVVEGSAGIGKTALLARVADAAGADGMDVLRARATELARDHTFGVVLQLFEPLLHGGRRELLDGPAARAAPLFEPAAALPADQGRELPLLHALYWLASNVADERPTLLCVDDAHWADRSSLRFLLYLAQRLVDLPVAVVLTLRPHEPDGTADDVLAELRAEPAVAVVALAPLGDAAAQELVRTRLPAAEPAFRAACVALTGGNPFLLRELLAEVVDAGIDATAAGAARLRGLAPDAIRRFVLARLARLPEQSGAFARAVSVLGVEATIHRAALLAGLDPERAAAVADGLVAVDVLSTDGRPAFVHPLLDAAVAAEIPASERAELHGRAARLLTAEAAAAGTVAAHLLLAPSRGDAWTVERLRAAASEALARGAAESAVRYLRRALAEPPRSEDLLDVLVELAEAESVAGAPEATARLEEALGHVDEAADRARVLLQLGWLLHKLGRLDEAAGCFEDALDVADREADPDLHAELRASYIAAAFLVPSRAGDAHADAVEVLDLPAEALGATDRALLAQVATQKLFAAEPSGEVRLLAQRVLADGQLVDEEGADSVTLWHAVGCLSWCDALDEAEQAIEHAIADAHARGMTVTLAQCLYARSWPRFWRGRIDDAAADARAAVEAWRGGWGYYLPAAVHWLAVSLVERDEGDAALEALELGGDADRWAGTALMIKWHDARGSVAFARGDHATAYAEHRAAGELARASMIVNPAISPWRSGAALAAAQAGDADQARALVDEEVGLARRFGAPRPLAAALRTMARVPGGDAVEPLREAVTVLDGSPALLELAGARVDLGAALRRGGYDREAREHLKAGLDLARRCPGAVRLRGRAREELVAAGGRPRRDAATGADALTPSERRVAALAAAGLQNPAIAQQLFLSRKTVEWHLTRVFRKLDIASREEIAAALER